MMRKIILVVFSLAAIGVGALDLIGRLPRRSESGGDWLFRSEAVALASGDGVLNLFVYRCPDCGGFGEHTADCESRAQWNKCGSASHTAVCDLRVLEFGLVVSNFVGTQMYLFSIPTLPMFVILAAWPFVAFIRGPVRRYRRRKLGLCVACGYDLTGNISGACPECGTPYQ